MSNGPSALSPDPTTRAPELGDSLVAWAGADQAVRASLRGLIAAGVPPDSDSALAVLARVDSVDRANAGRLERLIRRHGWPSRGLVGREGAGAAFTIVQHADHDPEFQKRYLAFLEESFRAGEAPGEAVALLTDRIRVDEGRPQLYGTQATLDDGVVVFAPIEDEEGVDERRAALGLPPLEEYRELLREAYGLPGGRRASDPVTREEDMAHES